MNPLELSELHPERLASVLEHHRQEISENWISALRQKWADQAGKKLAFLDQKMADRKDLFSFLRACSGKTDGYYQCVAPLVNLDLITSREYSVLDVFDEVVSLKDSILHLLTTLEISENEREQLTFLVHEHIFALVQGLLCGTRELLSCLVDGGMRGYCQVDEQGRIVCADQEFQRLLGNRKPTPGEPLDQLFVEHDRGFFTKVFTGQSDTLPGSRVLHLESSLKGPIPVGTELCHLVMGGQQQGWYVCLVDLSKIKEKELELYDNLPVGLLQVDKELNFRYANPRFLEILGLKKNEWQGKTLWEFVPDKENHDIIVGELKQRRQGERGDYLVTFTRPNGHQVPVKIYSVREEDLEGNDIGSFAIIRSMEREQVVAAMGRHMATARHWPDMLTGVAKELSHLIPYDLLTISEVSTDSKHIRRLHTYSPVGETVKWETRWMHVPDKLVEWIKEHNTVVSIDNLDTFLSAPDWQELRSMEDVDNLLKRFKSCLRYPVVRDRVIASVNLFHRQEGFYTEKHQELLAALPLDKVVFMALGTIEDERNHFHFDLIRDITSVCHDIDQVIKTIVDRLADYYGCNVALFQADEETRHFRLLQQKAAKHRFPKDYRQPFEEGILGYVYRTRKDVNIGDVQEDPTFKDIVKLVWKKTHSEVCLFIPSAEDCWLLNIEDDRKYILSPEEFKDLQEFRDKMTQFLERIWLYHSLKVVWDCTSDAIIRTDRRGVIKEVNPAAAQLLGFTPEAMQGQSLRTYFQDPAAAERAVKSGIILENQEVAWKKKDGPPVKVLLSASSLPPPFGGKIFTAKDLKPRLQAKKLRHMEKLHQEIANQIKTPLSLIFAWLNRLHTKLPADEGETLDKVLKQLHKVELTCDRLSLYDDDRAGWVPYHEMLLDSSEIVDKVLSALPESEKEKIDPEFQEPLPCLRGDLFQLTFCLESILSYLLRVIPEDTRIGLKVFQEDGHLIMKVAGHFPDPQEIEDYRAWAAMALGEGAIRAFMTKHHGAYKPKRDGDQMVFRLALPIARGES